MPVSLPGFGRRRTCARRRRAPLRHRLIGAVGIEALEADETCGWLFTLAIWGIDIGDAGQFRSAPLTFAAAIGPELAGLALT